MIDWTRVDELRAEIGEDDFMEVVELFIEEVDEVIDRLSTAPEPATFSDDFHFLKGSALNLGFAAFAELCAGIEKATAADQGASVDLEGAIASYQASRTAFSEGLAALAA